jgi:hypothetical protein
VQLGHSVLARHRRSLTDIANRASRLRRRLIFRSIPLSSLGDASARRHRDLRLRALAHDRSSCSPDFLADVSLGVTRFERVESLFEKTSEIVVHDRAMSYANHHDKKNLVASRFMGACDRRNLIEPCVKTY